MCERKRERGRGENEKGDREKEGGQSSCFPKYTRLAAGFHWQQASRTQNRAHFAQSQVSLGLPFLKLQARRNARRASFDGVARAVFFLSVLLGRLPK